MLKMNTNLYDHDGTLSTQAQLLLSPKPTDMSMQEWIKLSKEFRSRLSEEDIINFNQLKNKARCKVYYQRHEIKLREKNKKASKTYYHMHRNERLARRKAYQQENKEKLNAQSKAYNQKRGREVSAKYRLENKEKIKEREAKRRKTPKYKLRKAVISAFERIKKDKPVNTLTLLGCTWEEAKAHIESLFTEGMTWENHGQYGWHIDHIRPVSSFDDNELHLMNRIENLQPLWREDNLKKSDKVLNEI